MQHHGITLFSPEEKQTLKLAIQFIRDHYLERINQEDLALQFNISVKKIRVGFKQMTGFTVHKLLQKERIDKARELLADPAYPIKRIARETGFRDQSHFGDVFKKWTGLTPTQYRFERTDYKNSFSAS